MNSRLFVGADTSLNGNLFVGGNKSYFIGDVSINSRLSIGSDASFSGRIDATSYNATSDYRIKTHVIRLDSTFTVDPLKPSFYYNTLLHKYDIGLIAHELQEAFPYLVTGEKDGEGFQSINYTGLIGVLIREIQELKRSVLDQDRRIRDLEDKPII
jgi:hypothetical protein